MGDRFDIDLGQIPGIVRGLGDRARDAQGALDDAKHLVSRVQGLGGSGASVAGSVSEAQRHIERARTGLFDVQRELASRGQRIATSEGYPELASAIQDATKPPPEHHWYDPITDVAGKAWDVVSSNPMESLHTALDVVGFVPVVGEVANGLNALIYLGEGDYANAALSGVALIPIAGGAALAARMGARGVKVVKGLRLADKAATDVADAAHGVRDVRAGVRLGADARNGTALREPIGQSRAALDRAQNARDALPRTTRFEEKTVSSDGGKTLSGWLEPRPGGYDRATPFEVRDYSDQIGHTLRGKGARDHVADGYFVGAENASHAEKQMAVRHPNEPLGVSKPVCSDCQDFMRKHALHQGQEQHVSDPFETWIFPADGGAPRRIPHPGR